MQGYGVPKALLVLFLSFIATAICAICIVGTASALFDIHSTIVGFALFIVIVGAAGLIVRTIAGVLLFTKESSVEFHVYCGTQNLNRNSAFGSPTMVSWPFAKLTATRTTLRLQSPWSDFKWTNDGASPNIQRSELSLGGFTIVNTAVGSAPPATFSVLPWRVKGVKNALRALGYNVSVQPTRAQKGSNRTILFLILWLAGSGFMIFGPLGVGEQFLSARGIFLHPARIAATVSSKDCAQKGQLTYRFAIDGTEHQAESFGNSVGCQALTVGGPVDVMYDSENPDWSAWTNDPSADYSSALGNLLVVGFGFPVLFAYAVLKKVWSAK